MDYETSPHAMGYVCVDLVKTLTGLDFQARRIATRLGYEYIGLTKSSSLIVAEALLDHVTAHRIELLVIPDVRHLRGRIPPDLAALTDIHDLSTTTTYERPTGHVTGQSAVPEDNAWV